MHVHARSLPKFGPSGRLKIRESHIRQPNQDAVTELLNRSNPRRPTQQAHGALYLQTQAVRRGEEWHLRIPRVIDEGDAIGQSANRLNRKYAWPKENP